MGHTTHHERCPVCGKAVLTSWAEAARLARLVRRRRGRKVIPYWSRRCQCFHAGARNHAYTRLTKRYKRASIGEERSLIP